MSSPSILARLKGLLPGRKAAAASAMESVLIKVPIHRFRCYEDFLRAATTKLWASWKAVDLIAQEVASTPFSVVRRGKTEAVRVDGLSGLLVAPNEWMTFAELVYLLVTHVRFTGNAYLLKDETLPGGVRPKRLIPINPKRVEIVLKKDGMLAGYRVKGNGVDVPVEVEDMIHFRRPHPNNDIYGIGDLEPMQPELADKIHGDAWREGFWKNGAAPSVLMTFKTPGTLSQEEFDLLKAKWLKEYSGERNAGKPAWLTGDWSVQKLGLAPDEMKAIESSKLATETIFTAHGVPLSVAGIRDAANYATAQIDEARFRKYAVAPMVGLIRDSLNTDLVGTWGEFELIFDLAWLVNMGAMIEAITPAFDRGMISINEGRRLLGLKPDPENPLWEQHFISAALLPLDLAGIGDATGSTQQQARRIVDLAQQAFLGGSRPPVGSLAETAEDGGE